MNNFFIGAGSAIVALTALTAYLTASPFWIGSELSVATIAIAAIYAYQRGWVDAKWFRRNVPRGSEADQFRNDLRRLRNLVVVTAERYKDSDQIVGSLRQILVGDLIQFWLEIDDILKGTDEGVKMIKASYMNAASEVSTKASKKPKEDPIQQTVTYVDTPAEAPPKPPGFAGGGSSQKPVDSSIENLVDSAYYNVVLANGRSEISTGAQIKKTVRETGLRLNVDFFIQGFAAAPTGNPYYR